MAVEACRVQPIFFEVCLSRNNGGKMFGMAIAVARVPHLAGRVPVDVYSAIFVELLVVEVVSLVAIGPLKADRIVLGDGERVEAFAATLGRLREASHASQAEVLAAALAYY